MLIPYNTDAPIYHLPLATVGLIIVNTVVFFGTVAAVDSIEELEQLTWLMLETRTINPVQWLTNNFMHGGLLHLVGNMFFLWAFGLVIEGKLGWWRFLIVYLLIGVAYGALIQVPCFLLGIDEICLGASAAIFGLIALAVIWAPKNDLGCFYFISIVPGTAQIPIQVFGAIYFGLQMLPLILGGFHLSTPLLHLTGLVVGVPVGILMLRKGLVDCEGWDIFNVMRGTNTRLISEKDKDGQKLLEATRRKRLGLTADAGQENLNMPQTARSKPKPAAARKQKRNKQANQAQEVSLVDRSMAEAIQSGNTHAAIAIYRSQKKQHPEWEPTPPVARRLINVQLREKKYREAAQLILGVIRQDPAGTIDYRLKLAQILVQIERRPRDAVGLVKQVASHLTPEQRPKANAIIRAAKQQLAVLDPNAQLQKKDAQP